MNIDIDFMATLMLLLAFAFSFVNIYILHNLKKQLKEDLLKKHFRLISKEISLVEKDMMLSESKVALNTAKVDALEKVLAALLASGGGFNPNDDMMH
tara:strand:- start:756 stop:1046 length:291 start_codon:yes stop_codon:yes gene_type:complete